MTEPELKKLKTITVKTTLGSKKFEFILINVNYRYPVLLNPKMEKLIVSVNGKETEIKL